MSIYTVPYEKSLEFWAAKDIMRRRVDICAFSRAEDGSQWVAQPVLFSEVREVETLAVSDPTLSLSFSEAVALATALHDAGIRPLNFSDPTPVVGAMQSHIKDLREIAFKALKITEEKSK